MARAFSKQALPPRRRGGAARVSGDCTAAVLGGGIAGLAAATVLAERGVRVTVFEKESFLGGRAGSWEDRLSDGTPFEMERGFHGFFRQYYNLRSLIARVDPGFESLTQLRDYPVLGPNGQQESFSNLPVLPPWNVAALVGRSRSLRFRDLPAVNARAALSMLAFDDAKTYAAHDEQTATAYLNSLRFPDKARRMLFDVFSHSFFNPEGEYSAAELLMNFHFYFMGNPEGLIFDVAKGPFSRTLWEPLRRYLAARGVVFRMHTEVRAVERGAAGFQVFLEEPQPTSRAQHVDQLVCALSVPGVQRLVAASPSLGNNAWRAQVASLGVTHPFVVWRLWLDRPCNGGRPPFAGTAGMGILDNISLYHEFEDESRAWAKRTGGSVVELHAYAVHPDRDEASIRTELLAGLHALYPETRAARVVDERYLARRDCPSFAPGTNGLRPGVVTPDADLALAGDYVKTEFPSALMEKAATTGFLAANHLLARHHAEEEPIHTIPPRGMLAGWVG